jgi:threonine/homoserine/homoserine lactone efflux protein
MKTKDYPFAGLPKHLLLGFLVSGIGALPLSVLNLMAVQITATNERAEAVHFAIGAVLVELIVVAITLIGARWLTKRPQVVRWIKVIGPLLLLILGSYYLYAGSFKTSVTTAVFPIPSGSFFWLGILTNALNFLQWTFWLTWNSIVSERGWLVSGRWRYTVYTLGIGLGSMTVFLLFIFLGEQFSELILSNQPVFLQLVGAILLGMVLIPKLRNAKKGLTWGQLWHRTTHWEYWPAWTIYLPMSFYYTYLSIKARSFGFFNAVNPSIENGGFVGELKSDITPLIPSEWHPTTILVSHLLPEPPSKAHLAAQNIEFPCFAKPDLGAKGRLAAYINDEAALDKYHKEVGEPYLIQSLIEWPLEVGIFYYRYPSQPKGVISGIAFKEGIKLIGDNVQTIEALLKSSPRYTVFAQEIIHRIGSEAQNVLKSGESVLLSSIGNHARGATFYDMTGKASVALHQTMDLIASRIAGFYYGRLDIKFDSWETFEKGQNFTIVEVNGAGSEPTHMYDPKHSYFFALREYARHWRVMGQIAIENKRNGAEFTSFWGCMRLIRKYF